MILLRIAADIGEGQDHHREARWPLPVRLGGGRRGRRAFRARPDRIDTHRPRDVLEVLVAEIDEIRIDLAAHVVIGRARDQNAARLANPLQPRRDVDAVAENVVALDQHVAEIDADAVDDALGFGRPGVALDHQLLDRNRAFDGGDDRRKLQQQAVARRLDDAPADACYDWARRLAMLPNAKRRPRLVLAHESRVADDVGGEDRGEAAGRGHCSGTPALRMPSKTGSSPAR